MKKTWNLLSWFLLVLKYWLVLLILLLISWRFESVIIFKGMGFIKGGLFRLAGFLVLRTSFFIRYLVRRRRKEEE